MRTTTDSAASKSDGLDDGTAPVIESSLLTAYLAIRLVHLAQGAICTFTGSSSYRRPKLAALTLAACSVESAWLIQRSVRTRYVDSTAARVETATGAAGLLALAAATPFEDRTTSINWMLPYSVASTVGLALSAGRAEAATDVAALTCAYLATTLRPGIRPAQVVTAFANAASFAGFHSVAAAVVKRGRREGTLLDQTRKESAARAELLAKKEEQSRQHRLLHDSALQTLEAIANGLLNEPDAIQAQARAEARRLRRALAGNEPAGSLEEQIEELARQFALEGVEVDHSCGAVRELQPDAQQALIEATREALRNCLKHSGTRVVVVRAEPHEGGVRVTVRDQGVGFDMSAIGSGFGLGQSIQARMGEAGGTASIWSEPGRGTRVTLWCP